MIHLRTFSEAGGHPVNEDAFLAREVVDQPGRWLVCVADGQGGRAGGARAARLACDCVASGRDPRAADAVVATDPEAGFTTLAAFTVTNDTIEGQSSGDSAVLAVCGSGRVSELTEFQRKNPPVGSGDAVFVSFQAALVRPWKVLAMTDGVWKYVGWARVRDLAARLGGGELLAALQAAARLPRSGQFQDDFTVVLIEAD